MNAHKDVHAKAPAMQKTVNRIVALLVLFVLMLSFGCTIGYEVWKGSYKPRAWYLTDADVSFKEVVIAFIIAFNTLIPLSLYVSLEIIKLGQFLLLHDVEMYDPVTDTPMVANTTTILENLGQIRYVFSDKTGTLTENVMRFRKMSVAGTAWLHDADLRREAREEKTPDPSGGAVERKASKGKRKQTTRTSWRSTARPGHAPPLLTTEDFVRYLRNRPHSAFSRKARHFILCMALCHTCLPEKNAEGEVVSFQAASPDELALVEAAREMGYLLVDRPAQAIKLQFRDLDGRDMVRTYEVLDVIEFSSRRKRMSVVVRMPDGRVCLFTKGADSAILPRLKLSNLAAQKASAVEWRASKRKSVEQEKALRRRSTQRSNSNYNSNNARDSISLVRAARSSSRPRRSTSSFVPDEVDSWLTRRETEELDRQVAYDEAAYASPRPSIGGARKSFEFPRLFDDPLDGMVDENLALNEGAVFERCFQHVDDFSSEGLRTLLFAYRYVDEEEYRKWKAVRRRS
ncbi:hypothetical protein VTK73DRAFT_3728 [Phialemonium thermophilum]|uniref:P-type phospholipid transporter n=1 Tax=Phialemonium thermophilum TaxID=223376 RepID=A0ABR3VGX2_9PEZI